MKRILLVVLITCAAAWQPMAANSVDDASVKIAAELQKSYAKAGSQDVAIGDFVTVNNSHSTFGATLADALAEALTAKPSTKVIDQQRVNDVLAKREFSFNTSFDYQVLNDISYDIFQLTQETPTSYCFGAIKESGDDIKIMVKMVDAITGKSIATASVTFPSDETTDRLLGKPIRQRKPLVHDTVIVVKEKIVEKATEKQAPPAAAPTGQGFKIQGFVVTLKKCSFSGNDLVFSFVASNENDITKTLTMERGHVVDGDGNMVNCRMMSVGSINEGTYFRTDLMSNVPVKVTLAFSGLSPKLTVVKALQVTAQGQEFVLRDVLVDKE